MSLVLRAGHLLLVLLFLGQASAQTTAEYLKLRKKHGITQAAGVEALETLLGARVLEVKGVVKGVMSVGGVSSLILERSDGQPMIVEGRSVPDWLHGNEVPARLLVRASRSHESAEVRATLLGCAPEDAIARHDRSVAAVRPTPNPPKTASSKPAAGKPQPRRDWTLPASQVTPFYAGFIKQRNPRLSDAQAYEIGQGIVGFSLRYGVDARLIMAMVMIESGFNPNATSRVGAMGLGQLMPGTAKGLGIYNAYDSVENLYGTVRVVRGHLERYHKKTGGQSFEALVLALAAYNSGSGSVRKYGGVPPYRETQAYVRKVIALYRKLSGQ